MSVAEKWQRMPMLAFDTETSGVDVFTDRIVTATLIRTHPDKPTDTWHYIVDPGIPIPTAASDVHGYTNDRAQAEATHTPEQALFEITGRIALWMSHGWPLVAMNAPYDLTLLEAENQRHGIDTLVARLGGVGKVQPVIDPRVLDKHADTYRKGGRKLTDLCSLYGVQLQDAHSSSADALAAAQLVPAIITRHSRAFPGHTLASLHQSQIGWAREQMHSLRSYFDRQGTPHDGCCPSWPLHTTSCAPHHTNRETEGAHP